MVDETNTLPLIRTKLHRPPIDRGHIHRLNLLERLNRHRHRPLTLVSAPAGYGKSTLISCWLENCDRPSAWLSLDKNDNDLRIFLSYFIAAVQTIYPEVGHEIQGMLKAADLPPLPVITASLINDLDQIDQDLIFALDDYSI